MNRVNGWTLDWAADRVGRRAILLLRRNGQAVESQRCDVFDGQQVRDLVGTWCQRYRIPQQELEAALTAAAAECFAAMRSGRPPGRQSSPPPDAAASLGLAWPDPWPDPVALGDVLDEAMRYVQRYVWLTRQQAAAAVLWSAWTYTVERSDVAPILIINSPTKRCGKTTLVRVVASMLPRVLAAVSISPAALYRVVELAQPTLVIDEVDAFLADSEELRGLVNAGHTRDTAYVVRLDGENLLPRRFSVFGPKLLAGIGRLPATIEDRGIILTLQRKPPGAHCVRLDRDALARGAIIARKLRRWSLDEGERLKPTDDPACPEMLNDREADSWRPLLALADVAGAWWGLTARQAAVALAGAQQDEQDLAVALLRDVAGLVADDARCRWTPAELAVALAEMDDRPWREYRHGRPINGFQVSKTLSQFGLATRRSDGRRVFDAAELLAVAERYTPGVPAKRAPGAPVQRNLFEANELRRGACDGDWGEFGAACG
jgi:putative DNA primase/helicase